jgi:hypothetical protein
MSDSIGFNFVPYGDENAAETLFREYLEQLVASLDVTRTRSSCGRERALLVAVRGALDASDNIGGRNIRLAEVFDRLAEVFGWYGEEAELLGLWLSYHPALLKSNTKAEWEAQIRRAEELLDSDPYSRHGAYWQRCSDQGYDSFMCFWGHQTDPFARVVALIDEAAKALGDE